MGLQLIGPPGVGKTAILEGLATRIIAKEVPEVCRLYIGVPNPSILKANVIVSPTQTCPLYRPCRYHGWLWDPWRI